MEQLDKFKKQYKNLARARRKHIDKYGPFRRWHKESQFDSLQLFGLTRGYAVHMRAISEQLNNE